MNIDDEDLDLQDDNFSWDDDDDLSDIPDYEEEGEDDDDSLQKKSGVLFKMPEIVKYMEFRHEKRPARLDITKNSNEDARHPERYTKKALEDQLKKDYRYMKGKGYIMVQPFLILDEYPFKVKSSDSDIVRSDGKNVEEDLVIVLGRLPKFKGTEEFKGKPYIRGEIMFVRPGRYDIGVLRPHFALVVKKKYKVIKQGKRRVKKLFDIVKNELQNGKPYMVYKEFPQKII